MRRTRTPRSAVAVDRWLPAGALDIARPPRLDLRLLGPLEISVDGRPLALTSGRLRALLAVLAMSADRAVSVDRLAAAIWPDDLPHNAASTIQTYISRLRSALGATAIVTTAVGYTLDVPPEHVDALRFLRLLDAATLAEDTTVQRARLEEALSLWRGSPFEDVRSAWLEESETPQLVERYLAAIERRIDLDSAGGQYGELAAELRELTAKYPLRESLWIRLIELLNRAGRPAEALEAYETVRARIADELGVDPGRDLQRAYAGLLSGTGGAAAMTTWVTPRQLPAAVDGFVGRDPALSILDSRLLPRPGAVRPVVISLVTGPAGIGKSALAVHWAHRVATHFPDGQLYVDLRGQHPARSAVAAGDALRGVLEALHVRPEEMPSGVEARASLYRSLLADRRMLVVLDNAHDADQVRPLLPGGSGCLAMVTSRDELTSLVAATGARPLVLDQLTVAEARELLASRLGANRIQDEPGAVRDIIDATACLPLALAIVAARAATHPRSRLAVVAADLCGRHRPDRVGPVDLDGDPRAAHTWLRRAPAPPVHSCSACSTATLVRA